MPKHQGFSSIALIIIAVLILGGGYWVWKGKNVSPAPAPTTTDTNIEPPTPPTLFETSNLDIANWKTYRNEEYGFEFKYPNSWVQCAGIYPKNFLCIKDSPSADNDVIGPDKLELFLADDFFKGVTNTNQLKTYLGNQRGEFSLPVVERQIGDAVFVLAGGCDAGCNHSSLVFLKDGKLLEISYGADGETSVTKDQILSTFRFTK